MNINFIPILPELFMVCMILITLLINPFVGQNRRVVHILLTVFTIVGTAVVQFFVYTGGVAVSFNDMFILDQLSEWSKLAIYAVSIIVIVYSIRYMKDKRLPVGEFYIIFLFAILGMMVMVSANNMLVLYLGLELLSLALYVLVALNMDNVKSTEAAMKFFILGGLASGLLLFGISFIYGATGGELQLGSILNSTIMNSDSGSVQAILVFGLVFIVAGLAFKLGLVPFHMWMPDVYEGSLLATTTIIGTVTKIASLVFIFKFLINGLNGLSSQWSIMLDLLGICSLFIGNIVAIAQTNIKRMLGYSAVSHMGFLAFGVMVSPTSGTFAAILYIVIYILTALAGFGILMVLSVGNYECENIDDLKGLSRTHPICAIILLLVMFSMAGIPPLAGFYAKFKILEDLVAAGFIKTAIYAVLMSLIGTFYYLRIIKVMYFDESSSELREARVSIVTSSVVLINGLLLLVIGIVPTYIVELCSKLVR